MSVTPCVGETRSEAINEFVELVVGREVRYNSLCRLTMKLPGSTRSVVRLYGKPKFTTAGRTLKDVLYVVSRPWQVLSDRFQVTGRPHQRHRSFGQYGLQLFNQVVILVWFGNRDFFYEPAAFRAH